MKSLLYVSPSTDGWRNLGIDEYFLDHSDPDDILLHFYINHNAVIIGRGQNPWAECRLAEMEHDGVQLVRRVSGGGAVYHDEGNLNFSFITGKSHYDVKRQLGMILSAVRDLGIPCDFSGRNDLLADSRKFSGNAFCIRGDLCQHHGTLLVASDMGRLQNYLNVDPRKLKAKGAKSVRSRVCNLNEFIPALTVDDLLNALCKAFAAEYGEYRIIRAEEIDQNAIRPYILRQASNEWRLGKTPRFDTEIETRFPWGGIQLLLMLREGRIDTVDVFTDALDPLLPDTIKTLLQGVQYGSEPICSALLKSENSNVRELAAYIFSLNF